MREERGRRGEEERANVKEGDWGALSGGRREHRRTKKSCQGVALLSTALQMPL
jgi:hypothetical protein